MTENKVALLVKKYQSNILFGILFCILMLLPDFIFDALFKEIRYSTDIAFIVFLMAFGFCLSKAGRVVFCFVTALLFLIELVELCHIGYFGFPINPTDIPKIWGERGDVLESGWAAARDLWVVPVMTVCVFLALSVFFFKYRRQFGFSAVAVLIVLVCLSIKPERAMRKSLKSFLPSPTRYSLHNAINTFSFFAVKGWRAEPIEKIVPDGFWKPYAIADAPGFQSGDIVLIMGESTASRMMSLFGYSKKTTPFLDSLKGENFKAVSAVSGAVSTHSALPLFFNTVREPGNAREIRSKTANLFKSAKAAGYTTHFISAQNALQTHQIGTEFIDDVRTREDNLSCFYAEGDRCLVGMLDKILSDKSRKHFVVLNFKAVHSPYASVYEDDDRFAVFQGDKNNASARKRAEYENALLWMDDVVKQLLTVFWKYDDRDDIFAMTSDHGENTGENGKWGHNLLSLETAKVPFFVYSRSVAETGLPDNREITHYEIGKWVLSLFGKRLDNPNEDGKTFYIHGNNLYQDYDFLKTERGDDGAISVRSGTVVSRLTKYGKK